jgi:hypothetical protein
MKVLITKSNTSFVSVGDVTDLDTLPDGSEVMWSEFCKRYEPLAWCKRMWGVDYEQVNNDETEGL